MEKIVYNLNTFIKKSPTIFTLLFLLVFIIIFLSILFSYAYFTTSIQGEGKLITATTSNLTVHYNNGNEINETGMTNGSTITKTFYLTNNSNTSQTYKLSWQYLVNNFEFKDYLKYTITSTNSGGSLSSTKLPNTGKDLSIINSVSIGAHVTQTYTMTINYTYSSSNKDASKQLIGIFNISDTNGNVIIPETVTATDERNIEAEKYLSNFSLSEVLGKMYPVGSIYTSTSNTNPGTLFPGTTWEAYGQGRTLVGYDNSNDNFNAINKTGGILEEIVPYHRHSLEVNGAIAASAGAHTHSVTATATEEGSAHYHEVAQNGITFNSTATTISTVSSNGNNYSDHLFYGEHTHSVDSSHTSGSTTATNSGSESSHTHGFSIPSLSVSSSGAHTHTTTPENITTSAGSTHTHTIAAGAITSKNPAAITTSSASNHRHSMKKIWSNGSGSSSAYTMQSKRKLQNRYTANDGAHTHSIAANAITVTNTAAVTTGGGTSHTHTFSIPSLDIASSGAHTHTTIAKSGLTTKADDHFLLYANKGAYDDGYAYINYDLTTHEIESRSATFISFKIDTNESKTLNFTAATSTEKFFRIGISATDTPTFSGSTYVVSGSTLFGSGRTYTIPSGNKDKYLIFCIGERSQVYIDITLNNGLGKDHTHSIPQINATFSTTQTNAGSSHVHDISIPRLTSKNASAITVPNTNSGHTHTFSADIENAGSHTHTLSGKTQNVGTSGNANEANLQPYITVYMWKRLS